MKQEEEGRHRRCDAQEGGVSVGRALVGLAAIQEGTTGQTAHPKSACVRKFLGKILRFQEPEWRAQRE